MPKTNLHNMGKVDAGFKFYQFLAGSLKKGNGPVDLDRLNQQKVTLMILAKEEREAIDEEPSLAQSRRERAEDIEGLISFLDAFQDMLADDLKVWQYPEPEEQEC